MTGEQPQENNVIERKFGMGHIGTYVLNKWKLVKAWG